MPLTRIQITHAQTRIEQAKAAWVKTKLATLGEQPKVEDYTEEEKLAFLRSGVAKFSEGGNRYCRIIDAFEYPVLGKHVKQKAVYDAWDKARIAIHAEAQSIEDELIDQLIMSPDGSAALARIAEAFATAP